MQILTKERRANDGQSFGPGFFVGWLCSDIFYRSAGRGSLLLYFLTFIKKIKL